MMITEKSTKEIKGNLARLLATENLVVEHKKVETASFNVSTRVLVLPLWEKASNAVYDLLVGHEVGHALYTPNEDWPFSIPKDFLNVVEDVRVEKLMKRKYPGLSRDFYNGYKELNDMDFFVTEGRNINSYSLIDRINLYFKVGAYSLIPFSEKEKEIVDIVSEVETFDDVINACKKILEFVEEQKQQSLGELENIKDLSSQQKSSFGNSGSSSSTKPNEFDEEDFSDEFKSSSDNEDYNTEDEDEDEKESDTTSNLDDESSVDETVSETQRSFDKATEQLNDRFYRHEDYTYLEIADFNLNDVVIDFPVIHQYISKHFEDVYTERFKFWGDVYENVDTEYKKYKNESQKEVNYLVKEFECRKSADAYARAGQSKTGILDTKKLHTYKYNDDLFRKVTILPDGKNHGMIFILDWSGSMNRLLLNTYKQLLNLLWFCKKVQIPFEVYAFTYDFNPYLIDENYDNSKDIYVRGHNKIGLNKKFKLLNFISSRSTTRDFEKSLINVWRMCHYYSKSTGSYHVPAGLETSGTPLNESIIALHKIIPNFKSTSKSQKVSVCILTDGEANVIHHDVNLSEHKGFAYVDGKPYIGINTVSDDCILRDKKLGRTYRKFSRYSGVNSVTTILLENIKDNFPDVNLIGFRLCSGSDFSNFYRDVYDQYPSSSSEAVLKTWRKNKSWEFTDIGYDSLYYMADSSLSSESEFEVSSDASATQIGKAFRTMLKSKTTNKKILNSFVSVIS